MRPDPLYPESDAYIGNILEKTFDEIWFGETGKAFEFRKKLSEGILPIDKCKSCWALKSVDCDTAKSKLDTVTVPKGFLIENSVACNYKCVSCDPARKILMDKRKEKKIPMKSLEYISKLLKTLSVTNVYYFFLNEPFASISIHHELKMIKLYNPNCYITISTNASLIDTDDKRAAAMLVDELICSIDGGSQESAEKYQIGINFNKVVENLRNLVDYKKTATGKTKIVWKYVVFPWNENQEEIIKAIKISKSIGCDKIMFLAGTCDLPKSKFYEQEFFKNLNAKISGEYYEILN